MEIRIDTKRDSVDDIKKVIKFLQGFIEQDASSFESSEVPSGAFNLFSNQDTSNDSSDSNDKDDDDVQINPVIEPY